MNADTLKSQLLRDKQFLKSLYSGPNVLKNKRILTFSSDSELNTLLKYLYFVVNGHILINRDNFKVIEANKRLRLLQNQLEKKAVFYFS